MAPPGPPAAKPATATRFQSVDAAWLLGWKKRTRESNRAKAARFSTPRGASALAEGAGQARLRRRTRRGRAGRRLRMAYPTPRAHPLQTPSPHDRARAVHLLRAAPCPQGRRPRLHGAGAAPPQLQALLHRPEHLADRHLDDADRHQLAGLPAD